MKTQIFHARSPAEAVEKIRKTLGSDAVVVEVRSLRPQGFSRLWGKPILEIEAGLPDEPPAPIPDAQLELLVELKQELAQLKQTVQAAHAPVAAWEPASLEPLSISGWRIAPLLQNSGISPLNIERLLQALNARHPVAPDTLFGEVEAAKQLLKEIWSTRKVSRLGAGRTILLGAPGSGKTTALCKWLAQLVLLEGRRPRVYQLNGRKANASECLALHCEILGLPLERTPGRTKPDSEAIGEAEFIDLPGINPSDPGALQELSIQLQALGPASLFLVLNGAYETAHLLHQVRCFSSLNLDGLIVTHLDEERRWGKLWNLVIGTNDSVRFLSAGQNIPGDFFAATPEKLFARQFPQH